MKPIDRSNRKFEDVLIRIKDDIMSRNLQPGDKLLPEREMSEVLQVSRSSVREALRVLEIFDVIQSKPGEGTTLKKPEIAKLLTQYIPFLLVPASEVFDLIEARKLLEGAIAMGAAEKRKQEDIGRMKEALDRMKTGDFESQIQADLDFHYAMSIAACNKTLADIMFIITDIVSINLSMNRLFMNKESGFNEELCLLHHEILDAIVKQDALRAKKALENSLDYSIVTIKKLREKQGNAARG